MEFTGEKFIPSDELSNQEIGIEHLHRYHSILTLIKGKVVLDIACGEGYGSALMAKTAEKVYGIDIDAEAISHAAIKYKATKPGTLHFLHGTVAQIPLPDHIVDVVVSFETIEHVDESTQQQFMNEVKRILKPGGILIISTPDKINYSERYKHKNEFHIREFDRSEFQEFLGKNFAFTRYFDQGYDIVSAITETDPLLVTELAICNWERPQKPFTRKYLIAIASDENIAEDQTFASVVFQVDRDYQEMMDRIVEKEAYILELGAWGKKLDAELIQAGNYIRDLQEEHRKSTDRIDEMDAHILERGAWAEKLETELTQARIHITALQKEHKRNFEKIVKLETTITDCHSKINEQQEQLMLMKGLHEKLKKEVDQKDSLISNQAARIEQLNANSIGLNKKISKLTNEISDKNHLIQETNSRINRLYQEKDVLTTTLAELYDSEGYKLLTKYYRLRNGLLPYKSRRYELIKKIVNKLRGKDNKTQPINIPVVSKNITSAVTSLSETTPAIIEKREVYLPFDFPVFSSPKVSIIIPAYNGWEVNYKCLCSINENTRGVSYEVIFADDMSTDETRNVKNYCKNIIHIRNESNLGFLKNANHAASFAKGEYLHFLNNDTEVMPEWLSSLITLMEKDQAIGMTGSKLIYPDGRLQEAGGILWDDASGWNYGHKQDPSAPEFNYVKEVDYISGASIMIRKKIWEELGGFDTIYTPAYCEDSDIAFRIRQLGYKVVYQPLSEVKHYEGYSHGKEADEQQAGKVKAYQAINNRKLFERWKDIFQTQHLPNGQHVFHARDKSVPKKTILVIDHYVPQFDKDAGSRTTFQYLELFTEMGLNVKFIGDNFYRHEPYTTILQQKGIEVLYGSYYAENWLNWIRDNESYIDFILLNRPHISIKYIDLIKSNMHGKIFYYIHDLHFHRELMEYRISKDPQKLKSSAQWKEIERALFSKSDVVLTPSTKEKEIIQGDFPGKSVAVMPAFFYPSIPDAIRNFEYRRDILFVGGFTHTPNVDAMLWFAEKVLPLIHKKNQEIRLIVVGSNTPDEVRILESPHLIIKGFVTDEELNDIYSTVRLSVIPLRFGAGLKGKTVEALAKGLPVVSTSFGIEGLEDIDEIAIAYDDEIAFADAIIGLYDNIKKLEELSAASVSYAKKHLTKTSAARFFKGLFNL